MDREITLFTLRRLLIATVLCGTLAACGTAATPAPARTLSDSVAAGGLVEPDGEERVVIPGLTGRVTHVYVDEGDRVEAGQVIAEIENAEYAAALAGAEASLRQRRAELDKIHNGARPEEIAQAVAALDGARAQEHLAAAELKRREAMSGRKLVSTEEVEQARAQAEASHAERERADAGLALLRAGARAEDRAAAEAAVAVATAARDQAKALFDKSLIRSPVQGVVLKRELREGETVVALAPLAVARIGDLRHLFVLADVDELDIGRVRVGQKASVGSDAFAGLSFPGTVTRVSQRMGKRNSASDDPSEKKDAKILETLIALDGTPPLPVGLRVDVKILVGKP